MDTQFFSWLSQSPLLDLARKAKKLPPWWLVILIALAIMVSTGTGGTLVILIQGFLYGFQYLTPTGISLPESLGPMVTGAWMSATLITSFGGIFLLIGLWIYLYEKRPFDSLGFQLPGAIKKYLKGFGLGVGIFASAVGLMALTGSLEWVPWKEGRTGLSAIAGVLVILPGWMIQGAAEEVLTRGWIMPILSVRYRPWIGILVSSSFFAIIHFLNTGFAILPVINLTLFGIFAAIYALREGSLWGICALHSAWNWVQGNGFGFQVSGNSWGGGSLLQFQGNENTLVHGGNFGPEGGLAVTLVLLAGILFQLFVLPRKPKGNPIENL